MKYLVACSVVLCMLIVVSRCHGDEPSLEPIPLPLPSPAAGSVTAAPASQTSLLTEGPELRPATESPAAVPADEPAARTRSNQVRPQSRTNVMQQAPVITQRRYVPAARQVVPATVQTRTVQTLRRATYVYDARVRAYRPVSAVVVTPAPQPVARLNVLRPASVAYRVAPAPAAQYVPVARPVLVRPKYYIPGQPVRNFVRAVTP